MIRTGRLFRVWKSGLVILTSSYKCDVSISQSSKGSLKYFVKHVKYCLCVYCRLYSVTIVWGTKKKGRMTSNCHKDTDWRNLVWWTNLSYNLKDVVVPGMSQESMWLFMWPCVCVNWDSFISGSFDPVWPLDWLHGNASTVRISHCLLFISLPYFFMLRNCYINNVGRSLPTPLVGFMALTWLS